MKVYKVEVICFDPNGESDLDDMIYELKNPDHFFTQIGSAESVEIGEWEDNHPVNNRTKVSEFIETANWTPESL
jgi:hypothetical protein